ncbi:MAG TPA: hypothetical protein VEH04_20375 [Verrucomicrobiae bacterium]|nr:hypothetical protein [Verrucomicrobiae bacterium]
MPFLQDIIHKIEVGVGPRYIRYALIVLAALAFLLLYNLRVAKNIGSPEAMDAAQLARNISEGRGYTTSYVRPFSIHLVSQAALKSSGETNAPRDPTGLKGGHPDISNPPVYPIVLAGLMKILPFEHSGSKAKPFWSSNGRFWRYQPDFLIAWFNQALFLGIVVLTFFWARSLFDQPVAITSAVLLFVSDVLWKFSSSGLSTMLLILVLMAVCWTLTAIQRELIEPKRNATWLLGMSALLGLLLGLATLTRYGAGWLLLPSLVLVIVFGGARRVPMALILVAAFVAAVIPWVARNVSVSGTFFGTVTYDLFKGASLYPEYTLDRSLDPDLRFAARPIWMKLLINSAILLRTELFTFGSGWVIMLFFAGLMVAFRNPLLARMRYWVFGSLVVCYLTQALGRTALSDENPGIHSENYLVLLLPFVTVYGAAFFQVLLENVQVPVAAMRHAIKAIFVALAGMPLLLLLLPPRGIPIQYPPYFPPAIQQISDWVKPNELVMSDVPWAVAWYGDRQCVWLTLDGTGNPDSVNNDETIFAINDGLKPVYGLYLTPRTMDMRFESDIIQGGSGSWGALVVSTLLTKDPQGRPMVPASFPLRSVAPNFLPEQMLLMDWARWNRPVETQAVPAASSQAK